MYLTSYNVLMQATESSGKSETVKSSVFLHCIGRKSRGICNTFTFAEQGDSMKFDKIIEKFDGYFTPKKNLTLLRFKIFTTPQQDGKVLMNFSLDYKNSAKVVTLHHFKIPYSAI